MGERKRLWSRTASSPGKVILFGEHAVVYGHPAVSIAVNLTTTVSTTAYDSGGLTLDGSPEGFARNPYLTEAAKMDNATNLDVHLRSELPRSSGLGSSAAVIAGFIATMAGHGGAAEKSSLAKKSFLAEFAAQKVGSPVDTSTVVAGGVVSVGGKGYGKNLWDIPELGGKGPWRVDRLPDPGWSWVVAYTGIPKATGDVVKAVRDKVAKDGQQVLADISAVAEAGISALFKGDREETGKLMNENNELLFTLGVGNSRIREIEDAVKGRSLGVKITGAGLGGSLVALPRKGEEDAVAQLFAREGTVPLVVRTQNEGVVIS